MRYDRPMRWYWTGLIAMTCAALAAPAWADEPPALARARALYNAGDFAGAIDAAADARDDGQWADASALVIARAHLEQYRRQGNAASLGAARTALGAVRAEALSPRDHVDLVVGLAQSLYLGEAFGAAAELFETALERAALLDSRDGLLLLDWWATALDRAAQSRPSDKRAPLFARIAERMKHEIRLDPANPVANYWAAVAARGAGDIDDAWSAAIAAWVRSSLDEASSATLREDLDRLVTQALIPERARTIPAQSPQDALASLRSEWEIVKQQWK